MFSTWKCYLCLCALLSVLYGTECAEVQERIKYPSVRRDDHTTYSYPGSQMKDPYRWLEDPDSEETKRFIQEQNKLSSSYLGSIEDRQRIHDKLEEIWNFPKIDIPPTKAGSFYYTSRNTGLQNQSVIFSQKDLSETPKVFFDPNKLSPDGSIFLRNTYFSGDGKIFAYCLGTNGTDWKTCHFKNVETGKDLPDKLEGLKFSSLQWARDRRGDGEGFFYTAYPKNSSGNNRLLDNEKGYFHRMGTKQSNDVLLLQFGQQPSWSITFTVSHDGNYLLAFPNVDFKANGLYLASLRNGINPGLLWQTIRPNITEASYEYIANQDSIFYFTSDYNAPRVQIIRMETDRNRNPRYNFTVLIPEHPQHTLNLARAVAQDKLFLIYLKDLSERIEVRNLKDGSLFEEIPLEGSVWSVSRKVMYQQELFFLYETLTIPTRVYRCTFPPENVNCEVVMKTDVPNLDLSTLESKIVFYESFDKTLIPMHIVKQKGLNETAPLLLYGYGGFNSLASQHFEIARLTFVKYFNGVFAFPGIRGGGDYGEMWHSAGSLLNKKTSFQDFQAAAEYLIKENYTTSSKLAITGSSNGGLLIGAAVNMNPELYCAAIPKVGVMDMLRYHKLGVGFWWVEEYGSSDSETYFNYLRSYSPLHNIQRYMLETMQYPSMLVMTGDHDDRVVPAHSYKYTAELQYRLGNLTQQKNPLLLQVTPRAGHSLGMMPSQEITEWSDIFAFLTKALDVEFSYSSGYRSHISVVSVFIYVCISYFIVL